MRKKDPGLVGSDTVDAVEHSRSGVAVEVAGADQDVVDVVGMEGEGPTDGLGS